MWAMHGILQEGGTFTTRPWGDPLTEEDTAWIGDKLIQAAEYYESQGIDLWR